MPQPSSLTWRHHLIWVRHRKRCPVYCYTLTCSACAPDFQRLVRAYRASRSQPRAGHICVMPCLASRFETRRTWSAV
jgi:hypothetical protein